MMENEIFVHVGYPKCASTTLQKHLFNNHSQLFNLGVYPSKNVGIDSSEKDLSALYLTNDDLRKFYENLINLDEIEYFHSDNEELFYNKIMSLCSGTKKKIIFSNEKLTSVFFAYKDNGVKAKRLKALLPGAKILFVVRNQHDLLVSQYRDHPFDPREFLIGPPVNIDKWFNIIWYTNSIKFKTTLNYYLVIKYYEKLFGKENIGIFLFEELVHDVSSFANNVAGFMNINKEEVISSLIGKHENRGVSASYNIYRRIKRKYDNKELWKVIDRKYGEILKSGKKRNYKLSQQNLQNLVRYYGQSNAKLMSEYGLELERYNYPVLRPIND